MGDDRMVPRLAFDGLKTRQHLVCGRIRLDQRYGTLFRYDQQQILVRE